MQVTKMNKDLLKYVLIVPNDLIKFDRITNNCMLRDFESICNKIMHSTTVPYLLIGLEIRGRYTTTV